MASSRDDQGDRAGSPVSEAFRTGNEGRLHKQLTELLPRLDEEAITHLLWLAELLVGTGEDDR